MNNIDILLQPVWNGDVNMSFSDSEKIEIEVRITNNSRKEITIEEIYLRVKQKGLKFLSFEEIFIEKKNNLIGPSQTYIFYYDLKDFLKIYGKKRKFGFVFKGSIPLKTPILDVSQFDSIVKGFYNYHF